MRFESPNPETAVIATIGVAPPFSIPSARMSFQKLKTDVTERLSNSPVHDN
jgi:hypothetical protein